MSKGIDNRKLPKGSKNHYTQPTRIPALSLSAERCYRTATVRESVPLQSFHGSPGRAQCRSVIAAPVILKESRSCTNTTARRFSRRHSFGKRSVFVIVPVPDPFESIFPITPKLRTTGACRSNRPEFSPRCTLVERSLSVTARYTFELLTF